MSRDTSAKNDSSRGWWMTAECGGVNDFPGGGANLFVRKKGAGSERFSLVMEGDPSYTIIVTSTTRQKRHSYTHF